MNNPFEPINARLNNLEALTLEVLQLLRSTNSTPATNAPRIGSKRQIQGITNWPDGTFYAKVREMPEGVVIRGKSKRLLFDLEKFEQWLKTPADADAPSFGPALKKKGGAS